MKTNAPLERLQAMQELLGQVEQDLKQMKAFQEAFAAKADRLAALSKYYEKQWLKDTTALEKHPSVDATYLSIRGEDTVWEVLTDYRDFQEKMIKILADELNRR